MLENLFSNKCRIKLSQHNGKYFVCLTDAQAATSITIQGLPQDTLVIKGDDFKSPDSVFNGQKGECKRADFIIFSNDGSKKKIIIIETKKGSADNKEIVQQLKGSKCFVEYCKKITAEFFDNHCLDSYQYRFVAIQKIRLDKRTTRDKSRGSKQSAHDTPDDYFKITNPKVLEFNHLSGRV